MVCKGFLIPSLQRAEMLLGPTEGGPLSGYRSVQQHAVVLVHSKNTYIHTSIYSYYWPRAQRWGV